MGQADQLDVRPAPGEPIMSLGHVACAALAQICSRVEPTFGGRPVRTSQRSPRGRTRRPVRRSFPCRLVPVLAPYRLVSPVRCPPGIRRHSRWGRCARRNGRCPQFGCAASSSATRPSGSTLARPQSITCTSPKFPPSRWPASSRGGSRRARGRRRPSDRRLEYRQKSRQVGCWTGPLGQKLG